MKKRWQDISKCGDEPIADGERRLDNPFYKGHRRYLDARHDFELLRDLTARGLRQVCSVTPRFAELEAYTGFFADDSRDTIQFGFGHRPMFRRTINDGAASEQGGTVVFSFGPTGQLAVVLYPRTSELGRPHEDHIFLFIGRCSALNLHERLPKIVKRLVEYTIVTSLDGSPSLRDWLMITWLRFWLHGQRGGKFTKATVSGGAIALTGKSVASTIGKIVAIVAVAGLTFGLSKLGWDAAARLFQ